jgi:hypothetical protein
MRRIAGAAGDIMSERNRRTRCQRACGWRAWHVGGALRRTSLYFACSLLAAIAIFLPGRAGAAPERHALLIGISNYRYVHPLEGPRYDARALRAALIEQWGFDPEHVEMLLDGDATRSRIQAGLASLIDRTHPGDYVLIFFSGHGTSRLDVRSPWPLPDGTGALIPADFTASGTLEEQTESLIVGRRDLRPVLEALDRSGRRVFVIVDSCFSGNAVRSLLAVSQMPLRYVALSEPKPVRDVPAYPVIDSVRGGAPPAAYPYRSVTFLAASGEHEAATDIGRELIERFPTSDGLPHGALTDAVLRVLTGRVPADSNSDGQVTYDELYRGVRQFMDERGYPHSPRLLPDGGGDREALVGRPVFELVKVPAAARAPVRESRLRVEVAGDLATLLPALRRNEEIELTSQAPDIVIRSDAGDLLLAAPGGDPIDRLEGGNPEALTQRLHREVWVRRVLRAPHAEGTFNVTVDLSAPQHRTIVVEGEPVAFTLATEKRAYVLMLGIDSEGTVSVLYPYDADAVPTPLAPGAALTVPNSEPSSALRVTFPFGVEYIVVAAIESRPAGLMQLAGRQVGPDSPLAPDLERILGEAEKQGAKASLRFRTVSAAPSP